MQIYTSRSARIAALAAVAALTLPAAANAGSPEEHGIVGYQMRAAVDRSEEAGRDWENPSELIAFAAPASAPAPAPAPAPSPEAAPGPAPAAEQAPAAEPEAAPVDHLPCLANYSRFTYPSEIEQVRTLSDHAQAQFCKRIMLASRYETLWMDFFGQSPEQMMPDRDDPTVEFRHRFGNTIPKVGSSGLQHDPNASETKHLQFHGAAFKIFHDVQQVGGDVNIIPENINPFTVESLEALVPEWGYCANPDRVVLNPIGRGGWKWDCTLYGANESFGSYHPNGIGPSYIDISALSSAEHSGLTISFGWTGDFWMW